MNVVIGINDQVPTSLTGCFWLTIENNEITELPDCSGLRILHCQNCKNLTKLPSMNLVSLMYGLHQDASDVICDNKICVSDDVFPHKIYNNFEKVMQESKIDKKELATNLLNLYNEYIKFVGRIHNYNQELLEMSENIN